MEHRVVQKAAQSSINGGFHIDNILNGIPVDTWRNQPNHIDYSNLIESKLHAIPSNLSIDDTYLALMKILNDAKQAIMNNLNVHIKDIVF